MAKQIARREVGLGLNISKFAKNAKNAEELLDQITEGRSVSLDARLNLGDTQAVLQKILDQKTVSIKTAIDVKDLMGIMERAIGDFEEQGSRSLAAMNRSFLDGFKNGLDGVEFRLDDGSLVHGYEAAIIQAEKLVDVNTAQAKIADTVTEKAQQQTNALKQQEKATKKLSAAQRGQLNMTAAIKRYNKLMSEIGRDHKAIGDPQNAGSDKWNIRDMVAEVDAALQTYYEPGHVNYEVKNESKEGTNQWKSETEKLKRFIKAFQGYADGLETTRNHLSKFDNTPQINTETQAIENNTQAIEKNTQAKKKARKQNLGYHAGDLGKADSYGSQAYTRRGTGHFGTGTYFVGDQKQLEGYNSRNGVSAPIEQVNFSKYNLFKPRDTEQAHELHRTLAMINHELKNMHKYDGVNLDFLQQAIDEENTAYISNFISKYIDEDAHKKYEAEALDYRDTLADLDEATVRRQIEDANFSLNKVIADELDDVWLLDDDFIEEQVKATMAENKRKLDNFNLNEEIAKRVVYDIEHGQFESILDAQTLKSNLVDRLASIFTDKTQDELSNALEQTFKVISEYSERDFYKLDSASTVFMKRLGYEGIDTRHTDLDNTAYGSVIYDLKGKDLKRRQEILRIQQQNAQSEQSVDSLRQQNSLLEQKITNLKTINSLLAEEELSEEQIVDIINAYRSAMEVAQDSPMFQEAEALKNQIAQKFAEEAGVQADAVHAILKDVSLSGEQAIEYFEQLAEGVPLDSIKKLEASADSTGNSYDGAAQDASELTAELTGANKAAEKLANTSKLIALHGLSLGNLKNAISTGGFPAPSIALTDPDVYSGGYGEATVVFKKSAIDPEVNPANKIYGVDAYTPTYPSFGYELNEDELIKASERTGIAIEELRLACDRAHENITDAVGTIGFSSNVSEALQDIYLKNRGMVIETRKVDDDVQNSFHRSEELFNNVVRDFITRDDVTFDAIVNDDKIQNEYIAAMKQYAADFNKANAEAIESFPQFAITDDSISKIIDVLKLARTDSKLYEDEKLSFEHDQAVVRGNMRVLDIADYNAKKSAFISENRSDYKKFVQDLISGILVKPNVRGFKDQRFDKTPEGIAAAIASYGGKNALYDEDPFLNSTMSTHEFVIAAAKTYNNMAEITSDMARLQKGADGTHTPLQSKYSPQAIAGVIASENNMDAKEVWVKMLEAVDGNHTAESIAKALRDSGLTVDDSTASHIAELADEARTVPTRYFEAKPQRALGLDEIEFVSLPSDFASTPEMKEALTSLGIKVVEHISGDMESRAQALKDGVQKFGAVDALPRLAEGINAVEDASKSATVAQERLAQTSQTRAISNRELAKFDAEKDKLIADYSLETDDAYQAKLQEAVQSVRSEVESGAINFGQALERFDSIMLDFWNSTYADVEEAGQAVKQMSDDQRAKMLQGVDFDSLYSGYTVSKENRSAIQGEIDKLGDLLVSQDMGVSHKDINTQIGNIVNLVAQSVETKRENDKSLVYTLDELGNYRTRKIHYDESVVAALGSRFNDVKPMFGEKLTSKSATGILNPDEFFTALSGELQSLIKSTFEAREHATWTDTTESILLGVGHVFSEAMAQHKGPKYSYEQVTEPNEIQFLKGKTIELIGNAVENVKQLLLTENAVEAVLEGQNEERRESLALQGQAAKQKAKAPDISTDEDEKDDYTPIMALSADDRARAIDLIRESEKNVGTEYFKDIKNEEALLNRLEDFTKTLASQDGYEFKNLAVQGNKGVVDLQRTNNNIRESLHFVYELNNGMLELNENTVRYQATSVKTFDQVQKAMQGSFDKYANAHPFEYLSDDLKTQWKDIESELKSADSSEALYDWQTKFFAFQDKADVEFGSDKVKNEVAQIEDILDRTKKKLDNTFRGTKIDPTGDLSDEQKEIYNNYIRISEAVEAYSKNVGNTSSANISAIRAEAAALNDTMEQYKQNLEKKTYTKDSHEVKMAEVAVRGVKADAGGLPYDGMGRLETALGAIKDTDTLEAFNQELELAKKSVAVLKKESASGSKALNDAARAVTTMRNASTEIKTLRDNLKLLGDVDGVAAATEALERMDKAATQFSKATDEQGTISAYTDFKKAKADYDAQYKFAQSSKRLAEAARRDKDAAEKTAKSNAQHYQNSLTLLDGLYKARKNLSSLQIDDSASGSDLKDAQREVDRLQEKYETSLRLIATEEDYNALLRQESDLQRDLEMFADEQLDAKYKKQQAAELAEATNVEKQTAREIAQYEQERAEIQRQQAANFNELIALQKKYNDADYNWHQADMTGGDKTPYNKQMESYIRRMQELRRETQLTAEQQLELDRINTDHRARKDKLIGTPDSFAIKKKDQLDDFDRWEANIKNVGAQSDETRQKIDGMRSALTQIQDNGELKQWIEDFKRLKKEVAFESTGKPTKDRMSATKDSLKAAKQELDALYKELNLDLDLGNAAPNANVVRSAYDQATEAINRCTKAIGEQSQEDVAAATRSAEIAKERINAYKVVQDIFEQTQQQEEASTGSKAIQGYYKALSATIQQINSLDTKMNSLKLKDDGSGTWAPLISSMESQREDLLAKVKDTVNEINTAFKGSFIVGDKVELPFSTMLDGLRDVSASSIIESFFSDIRVQESLTEQSIDKFVVNLQNAQNKAEEFAMTLIEKLSSVPKAAQTLSQLGRSGAIATDSEWYQGGLDRLATYSQYKSTLSQDPTSWSADQISNLQRLANEVDNYITSLDKAVSKEAQYFASKKQYVNIANLQNYDSIANDIDSMSNSTKRAKQDLEQFVNTFTDGKAIITGFSTSVDGISKIDFSVLEEGTNQFRTFSAEMGTFTNNVYTFETSMKNLSAGTDAAEKSLRTLSEAMARLKQLQNENPDLNVDDQFNKLMQSAQELKDKLAKVGESRDVWFQTTLKNLAMQAQNSVKEVAKLEQQWTKTQAAIKSGDLDKLGVIDKNGDIYAQMFTAISQAADGASIKIQSFDDKTNTLSYTLTDTDKNVINMTAHMDQLTGTVTTQQGNIGKLKGAWQEFGGSIGGILKETGKYAVNMLQVMDIIRYLRQGFNEVLEIDTALTELRKVTDETSATYNNFLQTMSKTGAVVGSTVKDLTTSASDWARLGYSIEEAGKLAENTMVLMNVSEFDNVSEATDTLVSALQAFKDESASADTLSMKIIDVFNQIGNSYAISTSDLADSLTRSSASLVAANNTLEQSVALTTAANTTIQNPEVVGTTLKTLAMRIRGVKTELEEAGEDTDGMITNTAKLQEKVQALTNVDGSGGVNILANSNEFKSTYDILLEISRIWDKMNDVDQAALLEIIAGKRAGSAVASILSNGDILENAYKDAMGADGSAQQELNIYLDSIQGKLDQLSNSTQTMWMNFMNSEVVKFFISLAGSIVQVVDKIGLLNTAVAAFVAKTAFKADSFGQFFDADEVGTKVRNWANGLKVVSASQTAVGVTAKVASVGVQLLNSVLTMGLSLAIGALVSWGLPKLVNWIDGLHISAKEAAEEAKELATEVEKLSETYRNAKKEFSDNLETLTTSSDANTYTTLLDEFERLTAGVNKYGENISLTSDQYERYKEICESIVGINPSIAAGYDSATEAIGNNAGVLQNLIDLQKEQARLNAAEFISYGAYADNGNFNDLASNAINAYKEAKEKFSKVVKDDDATYFNEHVKRGDDYVESGEMFGYDFFEIFGSAGIAVPTTDSDIDLRTRSDNVAHKIMELMGYEGIQSILEDYKDGMFFDSKAWLSTFAPDIVAHKDVIIEALGDNAEIVDAFKEWTGAIQDGSREVEASADGMISAFLQVPYAIEEYDGLSTGEKSFITEWIKNNEMFKIDENTTQDDILAAKQVIINTIRSIASGDYVTEINGVKVSAQTILDQMFSMDDSQVDYAKYRADMQSAISHLWDAIGGDTNTLGFTDKNALAISLGLEFVFDEGEDSENSKFIERAKEITGMNAEEIQKWMDSQPASVIKAMLKFDYSAVASTPENPVTLEDMADMVTADVTVGINVVSTYSQLSDAVSSYNDILAQTNEISGDNIEVTQEYKDALLEMCDSQEEIDELNECFDENNDLVVKNSRALRKLVQEKKKELAADTRLAKAQSQLEYYDLVKQLDSTLNGVENLDSATMGAVNSILSQIDVVKQAIYQYQLLEDSLLGTTSAFEKYQQAQEIDELNTYGDDYVSMAQTMYDAFYKTGEVGTQANWEAIQALVPPEVYQHLKDEGDQLKAIYEYFNKNILPTLTLEEDQFSLDYDAVENFVEKGMGKGVFVKDETKDGKTNLDLVEGMNLDKAAELMGMTETQAYALFAALDKFNFNGDGPSFLEKLDDSLSGDIMEVTSNIEELNKEKLALLEGGVTGDEQKRIDEINTSLGKNKQELQSLGATAYNTWQQYTQIDSAIAKLGEVEDASVKVSEALPEEIITSLGLTGEETVQQAYDILLAKQLELEQPTVLTAQLAIDSISNQIADLEALLADPKKLKIEAEESGQTVEEVKTDIQEKIQSLKDDKVAIATTFGIELSEEDKASLKEELNSIEQFKINDKNFTVVGHGTSETMQWLEKINNYKISDKSYTTTHKILTTNEIKTVRSAAGGGGRLIMVDGTAHADGTAYKGGSWGAPKTETALTGELGPEIRVRGKKWELLGEHGAEFNEVRKGDIIFNHKQTEELLKNGYITGRGKAYAEGTIGGAAYALWKPTSPDKTQSNKAGNKFSPSSSNISNASSKLSQAAEDISTASDKLSDDFKEIFDWIEVRIEEITEDLDLKSAKLENTFGSTKQNAIIDDMIDLNQKLYNNLTAGASKYYEYAAKLLEKVPAEYRDAAQDGSIAIESFVGTTGEKTLEAIENYREWVQKGADATQQAEETLTEISALAKQAIDNIVSDYENKRSSRDNKLEQYEAYNSLLETDLGFESEKIYNAMISENNKVITLLGQQRDAMQAELNKRVEAGEIKRGSQDWYDAVNDIAAVDTEIIELRTDVEDLQDSINELHWDKFDALIGRLEMVSDEAENLIDILSNSDAVDEAGNWTDEGITQLGLYAQKMEAAEVQAKKYKEEINYLNKNWKKLGYTEQEYIEKLDELKSGQYDAIQAYHDTKDAIVDLNSERVEAIKEGIQKEIDAYTELIETKKEELDAEKDLYDFQKSIMDQEKDIADIQRQLAALSGDNSASARAKKAQLQAELAEANAALEESYYERSVSNQQEALDKELESFQEAKDKEIEGWEEYLENTELVVSDSLATIQANTDVVYQTLKSLGQEYSLSITDSLISPWKEGEYAIQSFSETFGISMSATVEELQALALEFKETMLEIENAGVDAVNSVKENAENYTKAEYKKPVTKEETTKEESKNKEETKTIKVGGKIDATGAKIYDYAGDKTGENQYYRKDPIYVVLEEKNGYLKVRHHKSSKGATGWFKKSDVKAYAKGTTGVSNDQLAWIDEMGLEEIVLHAQNGKLTYLSKGSAVLPHDISENLMQLGQLDPSVVLDQNRPQIGLPTAIQNTEVHIDASVGTLMHVDNFNGDDPAEVMKLINQALDKHTKNLNNSLKRFTR